MNYHVQVRLYNVNVASIDGVNCFLIYIDSNHSHFSRSKYCRSGQANVAEPYHANFFELHHISLIKSFSGCAMPATSEECAGRLVRRHKDYALWTCRYKPADSLTARPNHFE